MVSQMMVVGGPSNNFEQILKQLKEQRQVLVIDFFGFGHLFNKKQ